MKKTFLIAIAVALTTVSLAKGKESMKVPTPQVQEVQLTNEADSISYAIGVYTGSKMASITQVVEGVDMKVVAAAYANATLTEEMEKEYSKDLGEINEDLYKSGVNNVLLEDYAIFNGEEAMIFLRSKY